MLHRNTREEQIMPSYVTAIVKHCPMIRFNFDSYQWFQVVGNKEQLEQ